MSTLKPAHVNGRKKQTYHNPKPGEYNAFFLLSGPAAVSDLSVKTNSTNSLSFHWSPPEGDFDSYELFLYRRDDSLQERRRVQPSSLQSSFQGLTPGAPYRVVVVTHSGEQSNQTSVWARTGKQQGRDFAMLLLSMDICGFTIWACSSLNVKTLSLVPAAVVSLKASVGNQSDSLRVSWDRGPGDLSGYLLSLYNPNGSHQARMRLGSEANELLLSDLVPGRLYRAEVLSLSQELSNGASTLGRTGEGALLQPLT